MAEKVAKAGITREAGYLYFLDKNGNVSRTVMARGRKKGKGKQEVVAKTGVKREAGFLYYIDKAGDVSRTVMARGRKKK
jgi:hypothetical protein